MAIELVQGSILREVSVTADLSARSDRPPSLVMTYIPSVTIRPDHVSCRLVFDESGRLWTPGSSDPKVSGFRVLKSGLLGQTRHTTPVRPGDAPWVFVWVAGLLEQLNAAATAPLMADALIA